MISFFRQQTEKLLPVPVMEVIIAVLLGKNLEKILDLDLRLQVVQRNLSYHPVSHVQATFILLQYG